MKMRLMHRWINRTFAAIAILALSIGASSCGAVYEDQSDCAMRYRVAFRFVKNILHADVFGAQVTTIHLSVFDKSGKLILTKSEQRKLTETNDYFMDVDLLPGKYDLLAWCEGESLDSNPTSFELGKGNALSDLNAVLPLQTTGSSLYSDRDIVRLFHGMASDVVFPADYGMNTVGPVYLTKDTNHVTVLLQNVDGNPIDPTAIKFEITGKNNRLSSLNAVMPSSDSFIYEPWSIERTSASFDKPMTYATQAADNNSDTPSGVMAEFTLSRLMADMPQTLTVTLRSSGTKILSIPLVDYLLLVKGKYDAKYSDQDYLDCCDDYTLMFFIDEGMTWLKARVYINGWRIVPPQHEEI